MTDTDPTAEHRRQQVALYGEPLADIVRSIGSTLSLTQTEVAGLLGLSGPMLSHLVSARRVKIGNPVAGARLGQLRLLAAEVTAGQVGSEQVAERLAEIGSSAAALGGETTALRTTTGQGGSAESVQRLFRTVAGALDWLEAADLVAERQPEIAEVLRVYGAGRADAAEEHHRRVLDG